MMRYRAIFLATLTLTLWAPARMAHAQGFNDPYSIMRPEPGQRADQPEPWLAPKYRSPRGTREHVRIPRHHGRPLPPVAKVPPPIIAPETGRVLPNLPTLSPSGPHGTESFQDRANRCAHQAGVYGNAVGNRNAYIGTCVNQ